MPRARKRLICPETTPHYHVVSRCVRKGFLFGKDAHTGRSFDHRRQWIADRIKALAEVFAMDICAWAVMSNHYHLVLHLDREQGLAWDTAGVIRRWHAVFAGHPFTQRLLAGESLLAVECLRKRPRRLTEEAGVVVLLDQTQKVLQ